MLFSDVAKCFSEIEGTASRLSMSGIAAELFAKCKGLQFKHVPTRGGAEAYRQLLGKHCDFASGSGSHLIYVKQGLFRQLLLYLLM